MAEQPDQDAIARQWLQDNPNDPAAPGLRAKMRAKGLDVPDPSNLGSAATAIDPSPFIRGTGEFFGALPQGVLGIPESIYQIGEHTIGLPRPAGAIPDALRRYRDWAESSGAGTAGETVGNIGAFFGGGELLDLLGLGGKVLPEAVTRWGAMHPGTTTLARTASESAIAQPVEGDDFWTQKGEQTGLGALLGRILGRTSQQTAHDVATETNKAITLANESSATGNKAFDAALAAKNAKADAAAKTQAQQAAAALKATPAPVDPRKAVPAATTGGWWDRTLQTIGVTDPALTRAAPETGDKVRNVVGGRLNKIMGDMHLDPNDPALTEHLNDIRDTAERALPENERAGWYHEEPEPAPETLLYGPNKEPLERTTRGVREREPKPPTGTFYRTVIAPLKQHEGPLTGRDLTNYVSRIGARAEELAREAAVVPRERRTVLQAQADALRNVEDSIIGHAAGSPEQKLALEQARRAYFMWSIGKDAATGARSGVASPGQLITTMTRRLGGQARYQAALNDPKNPYHDTVTWLQSQLAAHTAEAPKVTPAQAAPPTPRTPERRRTPPLDPERPLAPVPGEPVRVGKIPRAAAQGAGAVAAGLLGHPFIATGLGTSAVRDLFRRGGEGPLEAILRRSLANRPRLQRAARATAGSTAAQADKLRKGAADLPQKAMDAMTYRVRKVIPNQ